MITTRMYSEESGRSSYLPRKRHLENPSEEKQSKRSRLYPHDQYQNTNIIPHGWLDCPPFGKEIGFIIPSKVPLSESYNDHLPPDKRYTFKRWLSNRSNNLGLVIDLTNTTRYYNPSTELRREGIEYVKIRCSGRDSVPDNVSVNTFVHELNQFKRHKKVSKYVLVHCTHGHNRTGFMIVHYLMRFRPMMSVTQALKTFSDARPPGIYKADYIDALYSFYHETKPESAVCPQTPEWKRSENEPLSSPCVHPSVEVKSKKMSNDDVLGDEIPYSQERCYQEFCYKMMNIKTEKRSSLQFPGSHPVSLDRKGFQLLRQRYYYATWKADGTRYMMLLTREGCYLIDRNFRFRRVQMRFPCKPHEPKVHDYTLLDGEMVVDNFLDGQGKPCQARKYLVYDMVAVNGESLVDRHFSERWSVIDREVVRPRNEEKRVTNHWYKYEMEPFGVRVKAFCILSAVEKKVFNKLIPLLSHDSDGIILQGWDDPYVYQRNQGLFKWKFLETIDFLFEVGGDGRYMLFLFENGRNKLMEEHTVEFRGDGWDKPGSYSGKLLECFWDKEDRVWVAMRVRVDKSQPNGMGTFRGVVKSINDDITKEVLLDEIKEIIRLPVYVERIRKDTQAAEERRHGNCKA